MSTLGDFDVCVLTPAGRGAVAVVAVSGLNAGSGVGQYFRSSSRIPTEQFAMQRIYFGRWGADDGEEVVACRTASAEFEIHCHGGVAAVSRIVEDLRRAGARQIDDAQWLSSQSIDEIQREAALALTCARTERCAGILLDQWQGAMSHAIGEVISLCKQAHASAALGRLQALTAYRALGRHLVEPFTVALAGPPNVGKSSLINALVGYERAIVYDAPGTTRDVVTAQTAIDGWPVTLSDTAGLREGADPLEAAGVQSARAQLSAVELVVLVFDARLALNADEQRLRAAFPGAIVVANKCDLVSEPKLRRQEPLIRTSAITGEGVSELLGAISHRLVPESPPACAAVPFTEDQTTVLTDAIRVLTGGDCASAARLLEALLRGASVSPRNG
ncbi:MAG TPA: GTP-binding protein [Pirellulales bacterium]|jgi:tRNA modification GTPase